MAAMAESGKVKWFNNAKGYGFIENPQGDVFVHYSEIQMDGYRTLKAGEEVKYQIEKTSNGLLAKEVSK